MNWNAAVLAWHVAAVQQEVEAHFKAEDELKARENFTSKHIASKVGWRVEIMVHALLTISWFHMPGLW